MDKTRYREIGSEFWNIPISQRESRLFSKETKWLLSGRTALEHIIFDIRQQFCVSSVAMPSWCCDSMIIPFVKSGLKVVFYTFDNLNSIPKCDILFCMEHFGYIRNEKKLSFEGIVIHDVTHSLFSENFGVKTVEGAKKQYIFGSLRKWAGFKTGGFASCINGEFVAKMPIATGDEYISLRAQAMLDKEKYISGESDSKEYLKLFSKAEEMLDCGAYGYVAESDIEAAKKLDANFIKAHRRENAAELLKSVSDIAIFPEIKEDDCPLFVPIRLKKEKRDALRKHLIENNVFCPVHWPLSEYHEITTEQKRIYDEELSLVCDQRYTAQDMQYICKLINNF